MNFKTLKKLQYLLIWLNLTIDLKNMEKFCDIFLQAFINLIHNVY